MRASWEARTAKVGVVGGTAAGWKAVTEVGVAATLVAAPVAASAEASRAAVARVAMPVDLLEAVASVAALAAPRAWVGVADARVEATEVAAWGAALAAAS